MAKRKHVAQRSRINEGAERPGFTRRTNMAPPSDRGTAWWVWLAGAAGVVALIVVIGYAAGLFGGSAQPATAACPAADPGRAPGPPAATPLANPPAQPLSDGTTATIVTDLGTVVFNVFCGSAPVAAQNFLNLADAGFYDGVVFHRVVPDFMIQGGDPEGTGGGGPGYAIQDEPIVGEYTRGMVAMARTAAPNSQGSQFFIIVTDSPFLEGGDYTIFGQVTQGMDVVDQIVEVPTANDDPSGVGGTALDPVIMRTVTIQRPEVELSTPS